MQIGGIKSIIELDFDRVSLGMCSECYVRVGCVVSCDVGALVRFLAPG